ncbi:MAG: hypothetical protein KBF98_06665 [Rhodoferax sp.]|nr:hypothetical protein [Rhodoferax sp.]
MAATSVTKVTCARPSSSFDGLTSRGYSVLVRVPAAWRIGGGQLVTSTAAKDEFYKQILRTDIIMPWHVGAYREDSYLNTWPERIREDINWAKARGKDYVPVVYPGFSRYNLENRVDDGSYRPRNKGSFYWMQASRALNVGAQMLFLAQFDEMDEGTQFFKVSQKVPVGASPFRIYDNVNNDHYLWLAGESGKMLRGEKAYTTTLPTRSGGSVASCFINTPSGNVTKKVGESLYVNVSGSDSDGVELSSDSAAPYEWNVPFAQTGTFVLTAKVKDLLGSYTDSSNSITVNVVSPATTLLNEGFENGFGNWTNEMWQTSTANKHSGNYAAVANDTSNNIYGKDLNTGSYNKMTVSFWYRDEGIDADDGVYLMFYDGATWVNVVDLNVTTENTWVSKTLTFTKSANPQYFKSNFKIRFRGNSIDSGEKLWLDDVKVTVE